MDRYYSYFVIKPDGIRYFPEINDKIQQEFEKVRYFKIDDYRYIVKKIYYKHYKKGGEEFASSFEQYLYGLNSIFGNKAILAIVCERDISDANEFRRRVFDLKQQIRNEYIDENTCLVTNNPNAFVRGNFIQIVDEQDNKIPQRNFTNMGNYRISDLNIIHCPDPDEATTAIELKILCDSGIISEENMFEVPNLNTALRYRTVEGFEFCSELHKPTISPFIKRDIDEANKISSFDEMEQ